MAKSLTPEEKAAAKADKQQEAKALRGFYDLVRRAHAKGALVDVQLPAGVTLEEVLAGKNPK